MKEGYSIKRIKDICKKESSNITQKELKGLSGKYPIYGAGGIIQCVNFYHQEHEYIGLVKDGSIGKILFLPPKSSVIGTLQYIIPKLGYNIRYIGYCLQSINLEKYKQGAVIPHIYFRDYGEASVLIANDPAEQQRIVAILDAEFAKIDALKANAEKSLQAANALFINSIEKVFANLEAPLIAVSSVADVSSGFAFKSTQFVPKGKYQVVRIGNVKQNSLRLSSSPVFINEIDNKIITKSELKKYDLVVTQTGTKHKMDYGFVAIVDVDNLLLNQRVARIRFKSPRLFAKWFLYYSYTKSYKEQFFAHEGGTVGQGNVSLSAITEMKIPIPNDSHTIKTNIELLDNLDERCKALQENYRKTIALCEDLKQALLRKAFNGEL